MRKLEKQLTGLIFVFIKTLLSEVSQTEKDKYCVITLMCGIFKKKITENRLVVARDRESGVRG